MEKVSVDNCMEIEKIQVFLVWKKCLSIDAWRLKKITSVLWQNKCSSMFWQQKTGGNLDSSITSFHTSIVVDESVSSVKLSNFPGYHSIKIQVIES